MKKQATTKDLMELIDGIAPFSLAESWDNSGLQAGNMSWPAKKILIALDVSMGAMIDAAKWGADTLLTHHPLMIHPLACIDFAAMPGAVIEMAAKHKISIISAHTNLDKAEGCLNDYFAQKLKLKQISPLQSPPLEKYQLELTSEKEKNTHGLGRTGIIDYIVSLDVFAEQVKEYLHLSSVRLVGNNAMKVSKVAVCTGSGGSLLKDVYRSGADVYVTGDMKYHEARDIEAAGLGLIDVGHFASEHIVIEMMMKKLDAALEKHGFDFKIKGYQKESDPFSII